MTEKASVTSSVERLCRLKLVNCLGKLYVFLTPEMVKSGKLRSGTGSKLKRWKKGHSSDSNPESNRFRQAAKSRFFSRPSGELRTARGTVANVSASTSHYLTSPEHNVCLYFLVCNFRVLGCSSWVYRWRQVSLMSSILLTFINDLCIWLCWISFASCMRLFNSLVWNVMDAFRA